MKPKPTPSGEPPYLIADKQPVFPCWLWAQSDGRKSYHSPGWESVPNVGAMRYAVHYTHWHPDQPDAPTTHPSEDGQDFSSNPHDHGMKPVGEVPGVPGMAKWAPQDSAGGAPTQQPQQTPRTDQWAECPEVFDKNGQPYAMTEIVPSEVARTLERDLTSTQQALAEARRKEQRVRDMALAQWGEMRDAHQKTIDDLATLRQQNEALRRDGEQAIDALHLADYTIRLWEDQMGRSTEQTRKAKDAIEAAMKEGRK